MLNEILVDEKKANSNFKQSGIQTNREQNDVFKCSVATRRCVRSPCTFSNAPFHFLVRRGDFFYTFISSSIRAMEFFKCMRKASSV